MSRRVWAVAVMSLCALIGFLAWSSPAQAQTTPTTPAPLYNPFPCGFIVSPASVNAGEQVTITGQGFPPGQPVTFTVNGIVIAQTTASADQAGTVNTTAVIPANLPPGTYEISVDCAGVSSTQSINVSSASAGNQNQGNQAGSGATSGSLTDTGADPMPFVKAALMLLALGGFLVLATKRRDHSRT